MNLLKHDAWGGQEETWLGIGSEGKSRFSCEANWRGSVARTRVRGHRALTGHTRELTQSAASTKPTQSSGDADANDNVLHLSNCLRKKGSCDATILDSAVLCPAPRGRNDSSCVVISFMRETDISQVCARLLLVAFVLLVTVQDKAWTCGARPE